MNALNNIQRVVSWNSKKNNDGTFTATAYSFDHNAPTVVHASYTRASRAQAVADAKKAVRYLKAQQRTA
jgi:hypothetical protein